MARPTDYTPELLEAARNYLVNYQDVGDVIPSVAGLAVALGKSRETLYDWARQPEKKEFSDILKELMARQEQRLVNGGLSGDMNSTITKLILTKHNYSDKQELTGSEGGPIAHSLSVEFVNADDPNS